MEHKYREGYKMTKFGDIPIEWEIKSLQQMVDEGIIIGHLDGNHGQLYPRSAEFSDTGVAYISANCIQNGRINYANAKFLPYKRAAQFKKGVAKNEDVLFAHNATVGPVALLKIEEDYVILGTSLTYYRCNKSKVKPEYLLYYMQSNNFIKQYKKVMGQTTRNQVPITIQREFLHIIPPINEQEKIAYGLSIVDTQISQTDTIIEKMKELKNGLIKRLLTKGIEHREFKQTEIGEIPVGWDTKTLSEIAVINPESLTNKTDSSLIINYIDIESVNTGKINGLKKISFGEAPSRARRIVRENDIIISTVRPYLRAFTIVRDSLDNMICSTGFAVIRPTGDNVPEFLYQCTLSDWFLAQLSNKMVGSNYPAVNASDVKETLVPVPSSSEQKKIASILRSIDQQIEKYENKQQRLNTLKNGLMQNLLTGNMRVTEL